MQYQQRSHSTARDYQINLNHQQDQNQSYKFHRECEQMRTSLEQQPAVNPYQHQQFPNSDNSSPVPGVPSWSKQYSQQQQQVHCPNNIQFNVFDSPDMPFYFSNGDPSSQAMFNSDASALGYNEDYNYGSSVATPCYNVGSGSQQPQMFGRSDIRPPFTASNSVDSSMNVVNSMSGSIPQNSQRTFSSQADLRATPTSMLQQQTAQFSSQAEMQSTYLSQQQTDPMQQQSSYGSSGNSYHNSNNNGNFQTPYNVPSMLNNNNPSFKFKISPPKHVLYPSVANQQAACNQESLQYNGYGASQQQIVQSPQLQQRKQSLAQVERAQRLERMQKMKELKEAHRSQQTQQAQRERQGYPQAQQVLSSLKPQLQQQLQRSPQTCNLPQGQQTHQIPRNQQQVLQMPHAQQEAQLRVHLQAQQQLQNKKLEQQYIRNQHQRASSLNRLPAQSIKPNQQPFQMARQVYQQVQQAEQVKQAQKTKKLCQAYSTQQSSGVQQQIQQSQLTQKLQESCQLYPNQPTPQQLQQSHQVPALQQALQQEMRSQQHQAIPQNLHVYQNQQNLQISQSAQVHSSQLSPQDQQRIMQNSPFEAAQQSFQVHPEEEIEEERSGLQTPEFPEEMYPHHQKSSQQSPQFQQELQLKLQAVQKNCNGYQNPQIQQTHQMVQPNQMQQTCHIQQPLQDQRVQQELQNQQLLEGYGVNSLDYLAATPPAYSDNVPGLDDCSPNVLPGREPQNYAMSQQQAFTQPQQPGFLVPVQGIENQNANYRSDSRTSNCSGYPMSQRSTSGVSSASCENPRSFQMTPHRTESRSSGIPSIEQMQSQLMSMNESFPLEGKDENAINSILTVYFDDSSPITEASMTQSEIRAFNEVQAAGNFNINKKDKDKELEKIADFALSLQEERVRAEEIQRMCQGVVGETSTPEALREMMMSISPDKPEELANELNELYYRSAEAAFTKAALQAENAAKADLTGSQELFPQPVVQKTSVEAEKDQRSSVSNSVPVAKTPSPDADEPKRKNFKKENTKLNAECREAPALEVPKRSRTEQKDRAEKSKRDEKSSDTAAKTKRDKSKARSKHEESSVAPYMPSSKKVERFDDASEDSFRPSSGVKQKIEDSEQLKANDREQKHRKKVEEAPRNGAKKAKDPKSRKRLAEDSLKATPKEQPHPPKKFRKLIDIADLFDPKPKDPKAKNGSKKTDAADKQVSNKKLDLKLEQKLREKQEEERRKKKAEIKAKHKRLEQERNRKMIVEDKSKKSSDQKRLREEQLRRLIREEQQRESEKAEKEALHKKSLEASQKSRNSSLSKIKSSETFTKQKRSDSFSKHKSLEAEPKKNYQGPRLIEDNLFPIEPVHIQRKQQEQKRQQELE
ncbi:hypothetical protein L596_002050 [Steinernema carpocapsae]|uniref:Uncharacterized protein n=1 Tax=Steinernema carpocapsae TaxID=34508 RepID=A0A4U8UN20_STECR|nr:hypothetical protein L596_002050 [Steinernema carpocapsae]